MAPVGSKLSFDQLVDAVLYKTTKSRSKTSRMQKYTIEELDAMENKLQVAASFLRGARNALQPVHKLPPELLTLVFDQTRQHLPSFLPMAETVSSNPDSNHYWLSLVNVCRHWRGIVAISPHLWSTIDSEVIPERFLKRSASAPLTVRLGMRSRSVISEKFLNTLVEQSGRIQELHLGADAWPSGLGSIYHRLSSSGPELASLTILTNGKDVVNGTLPPIFNGTMPNLRQLCLKYFTSWPSGYFGGLTHLCLYNQHEFTAPTSADFFDFLECSPMLEELSLVRAGPTRPDALDNPPSSFSPNTSSPSSRSGSRFVALDHLRELNLGDWPSSSIVSRFLSHLILPPTTDMYIWGDPLTNPQEDLGSLIPADYSRLHNLHGIKKWYFARQPRVILDTPFVAVTKGSPEPGDSSGSERIRTLYMYGTFTYTQIHPILSRYPLSEVTSLGLRDSCTPANSNANAVARSHRNRMPEGIWAEMFKCLPGLEELRIMAFRSGGITRAVLGALTPRGVGEKDGGILRAGQAQTRVNDGIAAEVTSVHEKSISSTRAGDHTYPSTSSPSPSPVPSSSSTPSPPTSAPTLIPVSASSPAPVVLCPALKTLTIEHDLHLPAYFISNVVSVRAALSSPISKIKVLVFNPRPFVDQIPPGRDGAGAGAGSDDGNWGTGTDADVDGNTDAMGAVEGEGEGEEYRLHTEDDKKLLQECMGEGNREEGDKGEARVVFEYDVPLSMCIVPESWPTRAYEWCRGLHS